MVKNTKDYPVLFKEYFYKMYSSEKGIEANMVYGVETASSRCLHTFEGVVEHIKHMNRTGNYLEFSNFEKKVVRVYEKPDGSLEAILKEGLDEEELDAFVKALMISIKNTSK